MFINVQQGPCNKSREFGLDWVVGSFSIARYSVYLTLNSLIWSIWNSESWSMNSYTIINVERTTYLSLELIWLYKLIKPDCRIIRAISVRLSNDDQFQIQAYLPVLDDKGIILEHNGLPHIDPHTDTRCRSVWVSWENSGDPKFLKHPTMHVSTHSD